MGVRKTESRIPGGFDKASELGYAKYYDADENYVLVSDLPQDIRLDLLDIDKKPLFNRYHLFVNTQNISPTNPDNIRYSWKISFYKEQVLYDTTASQETDDGCFILTSLAGINGTISISDLLEINKFTVQVKILDTDIEISLEHNIIGLNGYIENLFKEGDTYTSRGGTPSITRQLGNDYGLYFKECNDFYKKYDQEALEDVYTFTSLVAAIIYSYKLFGYLPLEMDNIKYWESMLNQDTIDSDNEKIELAKTPLGIAYINPSLLSMFLEKFDMSENGEGDKSLLTKVSWDPKKDHAAYTERRAEDFLNSNKVTEAQRIDIFNLLKFPKSAIFTCAAYLKALQQNVPVGSNVSNADTSERAAWKDLSNDELMENEKAIQTIVSEYENGPTINVEKFTNIAKNMYSKIFSKYIETIIKTDYLEYESIKIKVLDIRSGKPIKNALVKKVIIHYGNVKYGQEMNNPKHRTRDKIKPNDTTVVKGQKALNLLGYDNGKPGPNFGPKGRRQYNKYWEERSLGKNKPVYSLDKDFTGNPEEYLLEEIIKEYELCGKTDSEGYLTIRIQTVFLNKKEVYIDIGFWEFPIIVEREYIQGAISDYNIKRSYSAEIPTGFNVSWIGEQQSKWNDYLNSDGTYNENKHFGWVVSDKDGEHGAKLKVWQRIVVKDNLEEFNGWNKELFSPFYNETGDHFVLFGMEWCQPVWDGVADAEGENRVTDKTFVNRKNIKSQWIRGLNLHIVSQYSANSEVNPYGHYYGFFDTSTPTHRKNTNGSERIHQGIDLYSGDTGNIDCFASHGGITQRFNGTSGYAKNIKLMMTDLENKPYFRYAHLSSFYISNNDYILCGQKVGITGRSGISNNIYPSHIHFELNKSNGNDIEANLINELGIDNFKIDDINKLILPSNKLPLILPCQCTYGGNYNVPLNCNFNKKDVLKHCWAVQEFPYTDELMSKSSHNNPTHHQVIPIDTDEKKYYICPYISSSINKKAKVQALLKFLFVNQNSNNMYIDPGIIDDNIGTIPENIEINLKTNEFIEKLSGNTNKIHGGRLIKIEYGGVQGWIASDLIDSNKKPTVALKHILEKPVGKTRMAIYYFKKANGLLELNDNYISNFSMNDASWTKLNELAPIVTQASGGNTQ